MDNQVNVSRRRFLQAGAAVGGGLLVSFQIPALSRMAEAAAADGPFVPNAWIRIAPDETVTIMVGSSEMGQGVMTSIPMLAAEELDADWDHVRAEFAPEDKAYTNPIIGQQLTGGSTAVRGFWKTVREAGATARAMLVQAAADSWNVDPESCRARQGKVIHPGSGRSLSYGALADKAASVDVPQQVFLKEPDEFQLIGKPILRLDTPDKCNGSAVFGQDVKMPGMLIATVERCPVFGGKVKSVDVSAARSVKGVREVLQISSGVAVVADTFWSAHKGRQALKIQWDEGPHANLNSEGIRTQFKQAVDHGKDARNDGNAAGALNSADKTLEAVYEVPYLAHACMEPMNCTAHVRADACDVWVPTQAQTRTRKTVTDITGLRADKIQVHTTFLGGGFGRRSEQDFVADAVETSKKVGAPVKVIWTREDDTQHDYYRPATYNRLQAGIGQDGMPVAWVHRIAGPSIRARFSPEVEKSGMDSSSTEGAANLPYAIANIHVTYAMVNPGVPVGYWRSVGSSQNAFITECFFDEVAAAAGKDPFELRRALLNDHPRQKRCWNWLLKRLAGAVHRPKDVIAASPWPSPSVRLPPRWPRSRWTAARSGCTAWCVRWTAARRSIPIPLKPRYKAPSCMVLPRR